MESTNPTTEVKRSSAMKPGGSLAELERFPRLRSTRARSAGFIFRVIKKLGKAQIPRVRLVARLRSTSAKSWSPVTPRRAAACAARDVFATPGAN